MFAGFQTIPSRFHTDQTHIFFVDVRIKNTHRVGAATHACNDRIGLTAREFGHLYECFFPDHRLEIAHHHRIGMRARHRADDVIGMGDVGHPVAHRLVERILERFGAAFHRHHCSAKELHAIDILRLTLDVLRTHVDHALHAITRSNSRGGHTVLTCASLCDNTRLAHALGEHGLTDDVIDFVRAGVVQILALQIHLCTAKVRRPALGVIHRAGAAHIML